MRRPCLLGLGVLLVAASGCASAPPPPPQFALPYVGSVAEPAYTPLPGGLGVATLRSKPFYGRQRLAWRQGAEHNYHTDAKWEATPADMLAEAVLDAARAQHAFARADRHPAAWGPPPVVVVRGRIEAFDDTGAGRRRDAHVAAHIVLTDDTGRTIFWEGIVDERRPVQGNALTDLVRAFRDAQDAVADTIIAQARRVAIDAAAAGNE